MYRLFITMVAMALSRVVTAGASAPNKKSAVQVIGLFLVLTLIVNETSASSHLD